MRRFCADYCEIAPILRRFSHLKVDMRTKSGNQIPTTKKVGNPFIYWDFRLILLWVPGGTRTHDIQNHNLTL